MLRCEGGVHPTINSGQSESRHPARHFEGSPIPTVPASVFFSRRRSLLKVTERKQRHPKSAKSSDHVEDGPLHGAAAPWTDLQAALPSLSPPIADQVSILGGGLIEVCTTVPSKPDLSTNGCDKQVRLGPYPLA